MKNKKAGLNESIKRVMKIITTFFALIGFASSIVTIYTFTSDNPNKILSNYNTAFNFFKNEQFEEARHYFEIVYNKENNYKSTRYFLALLSLVEEDYKKLFELLYSDYDILDDNEKLLLAIAQYNNSDRMLNDLSFINAEKLLNSIADPLKLRSEIMGNYFLLSTRFAFIRSYEEGQSSFITNLYRVDRLISNINYFDGADVLLGELKFTISITEEEYTNLLSYNDLALGLCAEYLRHSFITDNLESIPQVLERLPQYYDSTILVPSPVYLKTLIKTLIEIYSWVTIADEYSKEIFIDSLNVLLELLMNNNSENKWDVEINQISESINRINEL